MSADALSRSVLVTGAAGFIGSHVMDRLLAEGQHVWGLDNFDAFYPRSMKESNLENARAHPEFRLTEGDLRDETVLDDLFCQGEFDAVVHLAARAGVSPSIQAAEEYYECNVMATVRLLETMRRFRVGALVLGSSSSVYGGNGQSGPFVEDDAADRPLSPYAATKRACELLCHTHYHLHELRCYCLRLFTVYGPRQRPDLAIHKFARAIFTGQPVPIYGDGSAERDYTYVGDTVDGIVRALYAATDLSNGSAFQVLNVGASRTVTVSRLVELLAEAMNSVPSVKYLPPQPGDVPRTWADIARAREVLGYQPKVSLEEGLRRFVAWFWARQGVGSMAASG